MPVSCETDGSPCRFWGFIRKGLPFFERAAVLFLADSGAAHSPPRMYRLEGENRIRRASAAINPIACRRREC
jgi:hypothetical protein